MRKACNLQKAGLFALAFLTLSLTSCIFQTGIPMVETEVINENNKTWEFSITKLIPQSGFKHMAIDNPISIRVNNSFDPATFGKVTLKQKSDNTIVEFIHDYNCTMSYRSVKQPNDTLIINGHALGASSVILAGIEYSTISLTGFKDFKGNTLSPIEEPTYNFRAVAKTPYLLSMTPGYKGALTSSGIKLVFNKAIEEFSLGKVELISSNSDVGPVTLTNGNSTIGAHTTNFTSDTILIKPKANLLPANIYSISSISDFKDKNGLSKSNVPSIPPTETGSYKIDVYGKLAEYNFNGDLMDSSGNLYKLKSAINSNSGLFDSDRTGATGSSLRFDGTKTALLNDKLLKIDNLRKNQTISLWFAPEIAPGTKEMPIFSKTGSTVGTGHDKTEIQLEIVENGGKYFLRAIIGHNGPGHISVSGKTALTSAVWHHAAVVVKNTTLYLYLNGKLEGNINLPSGNARLSDNLNKLIIGRSDIATTSHYKGRIDDFIIYNYPLSNTAIEAEYNSTKTGAITS